MPISTEFVEEKSALEEVGKVHAKLDVLQAIIEKIATSQKEMNTVLNSWTPLKHKNEQESKELTKIFSQGQIESQLLRNSESALDALVAASNAPESPAAPGEVEKSNVIKDIRLGYFFNISICLENNFIKIILILLN
jgi:hypothetical protein